MERKHFYAWPLLAALLAVMLVGCGGKQDAPAPEPLPAPVETQPTTPEPSATPEPDATPEPSAESDPEIISAYAAVLDQNCDVLYNGIRDEEDYPYVSSGLMEAAMYLERTERLQYVGYTFDDISGDGIPELLIGAMSSDDSDGLESVDIYAGYTYKDGEPTCFLDGWARNRYLWLGEGRFYNFGSGGAAYSAFGTFRISTDGTELQCEEFYFTEPKGEDYSDVGYYHNTTGIWDKSAAELLDITPETFWALADRYEAESLAPKLTRFDDYEYTGYVAQPLDCKVRADYADYLDDAAYKNSYYGDMSEYFALDEPFETAVLFRSDEEVADFTLLALTLKDVDTNGHATFDTDEVFCIPALRADIPLAIPMNFPGDIPSNGFSYKDEDGTTKTYTISISGFDGSLVIAPLD